MTQDEEVRDAQITIRIPRWIREVLEQEAKRERRSIADIIVFTLEQKYEKSHSLTKLLHGGKKKGNK